MDESDDHKARMRALKAEQDVQRRAAGDPARGLVLVHTGNCKGKSSAFGVIARALSAALALAAYLLGSTPLPPGRLLAALAGAGEPGDAVVVWAIRLLRAVAAFVVGVALGASGAALQGLLRNPLAEPGVLGVSAASALVATGVLYWWGLAERYA